MSTFLDMPLALLAGLLTIASPCILPVVPIIFGTAVEGSSRTRPLFIIAGFILAFTSFAMLLGIASSAAHVAQDSLRNGAVLALAVTGLLRVWPRPYEWLAEHIGPSLQRLASALPSVPHAAHSNTGGLLLGMSLGAVWTPCAGPVLASILVLVVKAQDPAWSALLLALYAIGAAMPMLAIIYGGQYMAHRTRLLARYTQHLQRVFGALVVLSAIAIYLQYDILIYTWLTTSSPL